MSDIEISFENTNNRTEVTKWYSIQGAPNMVHPRDSSQQFSPISARFVFVEGDLMDLVINSYPIKRDGSLSERVKQVPEIHKWNQKTWPEWLHELYKLAVNDFAADQRKTSVLV